MDVPNFPTDNLYKFMAIFGLVLFIFGLAYPLKVIEADEQLGFQAQLAVDQVTVQLRDLGDSIDFAKQRPKSDAATQELQQKLADVALANAKSGNLIEAKKRSRQWAKIYLAGCALIAIAGCALSGLGFWLWYHRVQRHLDAELAKNAKLATPPKKKTAK
ncbi:hypothetical protein [Pseudoxanthomonas sp. JBR18]|uniref:hypothetical protein n=1 Tax=Pseudoxanthomonas sp. JBR18 TaxID=2969308 RepID=UPI00230518BE|nr:hypothetical protein [Pseudoxanthomonas sp. JBR18]WCE02808.1 hypothetical protein PJ250_11705 [Pseudoxanthomonas sp. JBR18]